MKKILSIALAAVLVLGAATSCKKEPDPIFYSVTFDSDGGTEVASQKVADGGFATRPTDPAKEGFVFSEWRASGTETAWVFESTPVKYSLLLVAQWVTDGHAVAEMIAEVEELDPTDYTTASWEALQTVLEAVKEVSGNASATNDELLAAMAQLEEAVKALVTMGDKTLLTEAIELAEAQLESDYDAEAWGAFTEALEAAKAVVEDTQADQTQIDDALSALQEASDSLVPEAGSIEREELDTAINAADMLPSYGYTYDSFQALLAAIEAAQEVSDNEAATRGEIMEAIANLLAAIEALVEDNNPGDTGSGNTDPTSGIDKDALRARIEAVEGLYTEGNFTDSSWDGFVAALAAAKATAARSTASQAEVNAALDRLNHSISLLVHASIENPNSDIETDKSALQQSIGDAAGLLPGDYTGDSWAVFQSALSHANEILADETSSQAEIVLAYTNLQTAINNLEHNVEVDGTVIDLVNQLISAVNALPSADALRGNIVLQGLTILPATLADGIRDSLMPLLHGVDSSLFNSANSASLRLDSVLRVLGLDNLI
ncbi:MAG: FIVAR domain-containing protein [Alistipes sp.]|jgi:hypothetical protein|nr:FIVAR domain-containing protein [Alistipes sp.]